MTSDNNNENALEMMDMIVFSVVVGGYDSDLAHLMLLLHVSTVVFETDPGVIAT